MHNLHQADCWGACSLAARGQPENTAHVQQPPSTPKAAFRLARREASYSPASLSRMAGLARGAASAGAPTCIHLRRQGAGHSLQHPATLRLLCLEQHAANLRKRDAQGPIGGQANSPASTCLGACARRQQVTPGHPLQRQVITLSAQRNSMAACPPAVPSAPPSFPPSPTCGSSCAGASTSPACRCVDSACSAANCSTWRDWPSTW